MIQHQLSRPGHQRSHRQDRQRPHDDQDEAVERVESWAKSPPSLGDKHISTVDADGVALAAIQGLHKIVQEKDAKISSLEARIETLETLVETNYSSVRFTTQTSSARYGNLGMRAISAWSTSPRWSPPSRCVRSRRSWTAVCQRSSTEWLSACRSTRVATVQVPD